MFDRVSYIDSPSNLAMRKVFFSVVFSIQLLLTTNLSAQYNPIDSSYLSLQSIGKAKTNIDDDGETIFLINKNDLLFSLAQDEQVIFDGELMPITCGFVLKMWGEYLTLVDVETGNPISNTRFLLGERVLIERGKCENGISQLVISVIDQMR